MFSAALPLGSLLIWGRCCAWRPRRAQHLSSPHSHRPRERNAGTKPHLRASCHLEVFAHFYAVWWLPWWLRPAMWETRVRSLGWEDPLKKEMAAHSSSLAWRIPQTGEPYGLQSLGSQSQTQLSNFTSLRAVWGEEGLRSDVENVS